MHIEPWHKEIETGVDLLDKQHKEFIIKVNKFVIKVLAEKSTEAAEETIAFLQNYLLYHFQTEEAFQFESHYPGYLDHQAAHKNLAFRVKQVATNLKVNDYSSVAIEDFYKMIREWIEEHILVEDANFARYYLEYVQQEHKKQ